MCTIVYKLDENIAVGWQKKPQEKEKSQENRKLEKKENPED